MKKSWREMDAWLTRRGLSHTLSLARYRLHQATVPLLLEHVHGRCLDAGSGRSPYKAILRGRGVEVLSIDVEDRAGEVDIVTDIQCMEEVPDSSVDAVLCTQVLEHVPRPWDAAAEICRVLRPGGVLVLSVPHLSAIHEAPHDYYRYTCYGLRSLLGRAGLEVAELRPTAGLIAFLTHPASYVLMSSLGAIPAVRWLAWAVNYLLLVRLAGLADRAVGLGGTYPCDYVVLARRPAARPGQR